VGQAQHLEKQVREAFEVPLAEVADGAEIGAIVADDDQEGQVALAGGRDLPAGVDADGVGVEPEANEQGGVEGGLAAGLDLVGGVEGVKVELGNEVQKEEDEVPFGEAARGGERLLGVGCGVPRTLLLAPGGSHEGSSRQAIRPRPASTEDEHGSRQESPADRIGDQGYSDRLIGA
jgi:hypothetical protein